MGGEETWSSFRHYRNETRALLKKHYTKYVEDIFNDSADGKKRFFKLLPSKRKETGGITAIRTGDGEVYLHDNKEKAEALASFFQTVFTPRGDVVEPPGLETIRELQVPNMQPMHVGVEGVQLQKINGDKAMGPDGLHPFILKNCADALAPTLAYIINRSFSEGKVPCDWLVPMSHQSSRKGIGLPQVTIDLFH